MRFNLRTFRIALLCYAAFDLFFGGACGGFLPLTQLAAAQFTTVSGTVTDPNGLPYANGTIVPVLVTSASPTFTATGSAYAPPTQPVGLNVSGSFVMQLADNTQLSPAGTKWNFTVCSAGGTVQPAGGKGPVCFSLAAPITISGASQSITASLTAAALALTSISAGLPGSGTNPFTATSTLVLPAGSASNVQIGVNATNGWFWATGAVDCFVVSGFASIFCPNSNSPGTEMVSNGVYGWANSSNPATNAQDTGLSRGGVAVVDVGNGSSTDTTGILKAAGYISAGTTFTSSGGLNDSALTGGATAGKFTTATLTSGSTVITMGNGATAAHGWACSGFDITHPADIVQVAPTSTTTVTVTVAAITAGDVLQFGPCIAY